MEREQSKLSLSPTARRLIRSYGVLVLIAIAFLLMAIFIREKPKTVPANSMRVPVLHPSEGVARWL